MSIRTIVGAALLVLAAAPRVWAQACCAAPSLTVPARLGRDERWGMGAETRGRAVFGAFDAGGTFAATSDGDVETEQDLFAAVRLDRVQLAVSVPFVQTRRTVPGLSDWGGGIGDVRASAYVELTRAGARPHVPGLALVAGGSLPTGRPPDRSTSVLAADATGIGTFEGTLGVEIEERFERVFVTVLGAVAQRANREALGIREEFAPRFLVSGTAGFELDNRVALGAFVSGTQAGLSRDGATGREISGSDLALVTVGAAAQAPLWEGWRAQARLWIDGALDGLGRNQPAGAGLAVSALRFWP